MASEDKRSYVEHSHCVHKGVCACCAALQLCAVNRYGTYNVGEEHVDTHDGHRSILILVDRSTELAA